MNDGESFVCCRLRSQLVGWIVVEIMEVCDLDLLAGVMDDGVRREGDE